MFGAAAIYGHVTKRSLAKLGGILFMGLIGLLVAMVLNIFLGSTQVTWVISLVGVVLFTALTAYDVQRIQSGDHRRLHGLDGEGGRHRRSPALPGLHQHLPVHAPPPRRPQLAGQAPGWTRVAHDTSRGAHRSRRCPAADRFGRADGHARRGPRRRARAARSTGVGRPRCPAAGARRGSPGRRRSPSSAGSRTGPRSRCPRRRRRCAGRGRGRSTASTIDRSASPSRPATNVRSILIVSSGRCLR